MSYENKATASFSADKNELKRTRQDARMYGIFRKVEKPRPKRLRLPSRDLTRKELRDENVEAVICDSGGYTIKIGNSRDTNPKIMPNCIMKAKSERKRLFIGNQIDECRDCSGLFFLLPCEKGYITKWDVQKPIWDYAFSKSMCPLNDLPLIMTQPLMNFTSIQECMDEIFFEEYEVKSMIRVCPSDLAMLRYLESVEKCDSPCLVVDSGFSFTHVVPYINNKKYFKGTKRLNVGGKLLTNHLKDIISYRQYHVMEETFVINQVKEDTCYVSENFREDLKIASGPNNHISRNYVLPDFNNIRRGYIQVPNKIDQVAENCQILRLNNERFTVPEILFHPSDIGIKSMGIAEVIVKSITSCPLLYQKKLAENIVVVGGNAKFPGFKNRLYSEVRSLLSDSWEMNIFQPDDVMTYSWMGGKTLLKLPDFKSKLVTKEQYEEIGSAGIQQKFDDWAVGLEEETPRKTEIKPVSFIEHIKKYNVFGKADLSTEGVVSEETNANTTENEDTNKLTPESSEEPTELIDEATKINKNLRKTSVRSAPVLYSVRIVSSDIKRNT